MTPFRTAYLFELLDELRREAAGQYDGGTVDLCQALQNFLMDSRQGALCETI